MEQMLRTATWTSAALLLTGLGMWLSGAAAAERVLHAGLWLLISTPVARVLMALADYVQERDWRFAALTLVVLASLVFPLLRLFLSSRR